MRKPSLTTQFKRDIRGTSRSLGLQLPQNNQKGCNNQDGSYRHLDKWTAQDGQQ